MKQLSILASCCMLLLSACEKNEHDQGFCGEDRIFFGASNASDSLVHSFANEPAAAVKTLLLPLKLMGNLSDQDRIVEVEVDPAATTALQSEYELGEAIVPAGESIGHITVKLFNTARLENQKVQLGLRLKTSDHFRVEPEKPGNYDELVRFTVKWTNELVPPAEWPFNWGGYSQVKHRLVIDLTGYFHYSRFSFAPEFEVIGICNQWLDEYNASNSNPYQDEHGNNIRFCRNCL